MGVGRGYVELNGLQVILKTSNDYDYRKKRE